MLLSYVTTTSYEGRPFDSTSGTTLDTSTADLVGEKIYVWILNNTTAASANQQGIFSTNARWTDADEFDPTTRVSIDSGAPALTAHIGQLATGADIGGGANSHVLQLAGVIAPSNVIASRTPVGANIYVGTPVTFSYTAAGDAPFTQKWYKTGSATILGTGPTFTIATPQIADSGTYYVEVSNSAGPANSNNVSLNMLSPIAAFADHPDTQAVKVGSNVTFSITATGSGTLAYRWLKGAAAVAGATTDTLTLYGVSLTEAGLYRCEVSNVVAGKPYKVLSNQALLTVVQDNIPATRVVAKESATGFITLTLNYAETGVLAANKATLQWKKNGVIIAGQITKTLKVTPLAVSAAPVIYTCEVQAAGVASAVVGASTELIVVNQAPLITSPSTLNMPDGKVGEPYSFQVPVDATLTRTPGTYTAVGLPTGLVINKLTGLISGRPLAATAAGKTAKITITAANGVLPNATAIDEIVITGIASNLVGTWSGPIERGNLSQNLGGRFDMTITSTGAVSTGKITLGTAVHSFVGGFSFDSLNNVHTVTFSVRRAINQPPLQVSFNLAGNVLTDGVISDGTDPLAFEGWRSIWLASPVVSNAVGYVARYHMLTELADVLDLGDLGIPQGKGYASFSVAKDGKFTFAGKLADGETITFATYMGPTGQAFLFQTLLYKSVAKGSLLGKISIDSKGNADANDNTLSGDADWNRPPNSVSNTLYAAGFGPVSLAIAGGAYVAPVSTVAIPKVLLNLTPGTNNAEVVITDANLEDPETDTDDIIETATIAAASKITVGNTNTLGITMTGVPATGAISGNIKPATKLEKLEGLVVPVNGELLGVGFFLTDDASFQPVRRLSGSFTLSEKPAP
ncbi:MAG: immunoglobulin domain-containing protein [Prosthecobacter sp.]